MSDLFKSENKAKSNWFQFNKVGDSVSGVLIGKRHQDGVAPYPDQEVYELRQADGSVVNVGMSVNKRYVLDRMRNVKMGQEVGFKFEKEIPSKTKGMQAAKSIEVYVGDIVEDIETETPIEEIPFA
jgi:hypothetical protein